MRSFVTIPKLLAAVAVSAAGSLLLAGTGVTAPVAAVAAGPSDPVAAAGGWGVSTLDRVPEPVAGTEIQVGFTFRAHGRTPVDLADHGGRVGITVSPEGDGPREPMYFEARSEGSRGHHVADVVFPEPGTYTWQVEQGALPAQDLGEIEVEPASAADAADAADAATVAPGLRGNPLWRLLLPAAAVVSAGWAGVEVARRHRTAVTGAGAGTGTPDRA